LLSLYMVVVMGAIGVGQLLLTIADPSGFGLFILGTALMSLSVVPITFSVGPAPSFDLPTRVRLGELWPAPPVGLAGGFGAGLANGAIYAMYRIAVKEGVAVSEQERYLQVPARASSLIGVLTRGRRSR
jgi:hypothetical protein